MYWERTPEPSRYAAMTCPVFHRGHFFLPRPPTQRGSNAAGAGHMRSTDGAAAHLAPGAAYIFGCFRPSEVLTRPLWAPRICRS